MSVSSRLFGWEAILAVMLVAVFVVNSIATPWFLDIYNLADATYNFSEKAIIALPMALLILVREIDLSVGAIVALSAIGVGMAAAAGLSARCPRRRRAWHRAALRDVQRVPRDEHRRAVDRDHHRDHVAFPRYRPGEPRRPGADELSAGLHLAGPVLSDQPAAAAALLRAVRGSGGRLHAGPAFHGDRPEAVRDRREPGLGAVFRDPRGPPRGSGCSRCRGFCPVWRPRF